MRKTTIYLDGTDELLARAAVRRGRSRTDLIREAIRRHLGAEVAQPRRPRPLGRSGCTDTSRRVDEILADALGQ